MSTAAGTTPTRAAESTTSHHSDSFSSRNVFILSAIGSAVGLGNIWRFPYVAYENGGGAFIIPYIVALLCAGIPLLFLDYAIGHRYRGSAPLSFRRMARWTESLGWWQVAVCIIIAIYYAVIIAWAVMYMFFSLTQAWGSDPKGFLFGDFLQLSDEVGVGMTFVPQVLWPHILVWVATLAIIGLGVTKGIGRANTVFMPLLVIMFLVLVVQALFLPGAVDGLNALFTPNWAALADPGVWAAAVGQIFFSLSVGFGIMVTYSSYLSRKTDLTGSGLVVAFANSGFELLAGIGVFAALGFMAFNAGTGVDEVAAGGVGLAFVAFPTIISQAPLGPLVGVLFFGSLVFAGMTSLISIVEVIIAAFRDKLGISRVKATLLVGIPMAIVSTLLFPTTTGLYLLDVMDEFVNKYGILLGGLVAAVAVVLIVRKLPLLSRHLSAVSSVKAGGWWMALIGGLVPLALLGILIADVVKKMQTPYGDGDYPNWFLSTFGWGMAGLLIVVGIVMALLPWSKRVDTSFDEEHEDRAIAQVVADREQPLRTTGTDIEEAEL